MEEKETVREPYRMVLEGGQAELVEKKSRFIANVRPVESEAEAVAFIDEMKKKYWDARHNCSAFVIGTVLLPYCVWAGAAVLLAGTLLGYVRFAAGIHYPSDLLAGAALGIVFGLMAFI